MKILPLFFLLLLLFPLHMLTAQDTSVLSDRTGSPLPKFLSSKILMLYGISKFDVYSKIYDVNNYGLRFDVSFGVEIPSLPGLELSCGSSFFMIGNDVLFNVDREFDIDVDPTAGGTTLQECSMGASLTAVTAGVRLSYNLVFSPIKLGVETGMGACLVYERNDWNVDLGGGAFDADLERVDTVKPYFEGGLKALFLIGENHQVGIYAGVLFIPSTIQIEDPSTDYGPYTLNLLYQGGIVYQVTF